MDSAAGFAHLHPSGGGAPSPGPPHVGPQMTSVPTTPRIGDSDDHAPAEAHQEAFIAPEHPTMISS